MRNKISIIASAIGFISLFMLFSCASTEQYAKFTSNQQLADNMARIYVIRPSGYGSAIKMKIYGDGKFIGKLGPKSYLCWDVDTGEYGIKSIASNNDSVTITAKAGQNYYIQAKIDMGAVAAGTELVKMDKDEALKKVSKLKKPAIKYFE